MTFSFVFTYFLVAIICVAVSVAIMVQLTRDMGTEQELRAFRIYLIGYLVFSLTNAVWVWINYGYLAIPGTMFSIVNLIAVCISSYFWFRYIELRLNPQRVESSGFRIISVLPLAVAIVLVTTTPFTKLVFFYTSTNEYMHGPLYPTMAVLAILYLVVASADLVVHLRDSRSPLRRRQYTVFILFLVYPVLGGIIDILIPNLPIMELMLLLSTITVFISMQQSQIYNDVLTGLNNRRLADDYLIEHLALATPDAPLYLFLCDIDGFKQINDSYGHLEGDRALRLVAQALRDALSDIRCHIARWGGDEFVIIADGNAISSPDEVVKPIEQQLELCAQSEGLDYALTVSIGCAEADSPSTSAGELMRMADSEMYVAKHLKHAGGSVGSIAGINIGA